MKTIKQYHASNPIWFDGSETTDKKIRTAIKNKTLGAKREKGQLMIFDGQDVPKADERPSGQTSGATLKDAKMAMEIKIMKEKLRDMRLGILREATDIWLDEYQLPLLAALREIVRKHGTPEMETEWNDTIENTPRELSANLEARLIDFVDR